VAGCQLHRQECARVLSPNEGADNRRRPRMATAMRLAHVADAP
jgi:hypothetical protein